MKLFFLVVIFTFLLIQNNSAQYKDSLQTNFHWEMIILNNYATFHNRSEVNWGSAFLMKYENKIIACTSREFTGTSNSVEKMLLIKDFNKEIIKWKMYLPNDPSIYVQVDSIAFSKRIESHFLFNYHSRPLLTFSLKNVDDRIIPLEPEMRKFKNHEPVWIVSYDTDNKVKIIKGIIESGDSFNMVVDLRIKTNEFLSKSSCIGTPILDQYGKVIGIFNRAYQIRMDKHGNVLGEHNKKYSSKDSNFEYFVDAVSIRTLIGEY